MGSVGAGLMYRRVSRPIERSLIGITVLLSTLGGATLARANTGTIIGVELGMGFLASAAFAVAHVILTALGFRGDQVLMPLAAAAAAMGFTTVSRLRPDLSLRQAAFIWMGVAALALTALGYGSRWVRRSAPAAAVGAIVLLALTLIFGVDRGGARSWLAVAGIGFQPSEFVKIVSVLVAADALSHLDTATPQRHGRAGFGEMWRCAPVRRLLIAWGIMLLLVIAQRDVGTATVMFASSVALLYVASGNRLVTVLGMAVAVLGVVGAAQAFGHVKVRFVSWLDPWANASGAGYQVVQALYSFASGGILGRGYGTGSPWLIPAAATDMSFAASAEEVGLAGTLGAIMVYLLLVAHGYACAMRTKSRYLALSAVGAANLLAVQTFVIIGGNLGVLPLTGVTLPLASYGGSSMVASCMLVGIIMAASAYAADDDPGEPMPASHSAAFPREGDGHEL